MMNNVFLCEVVATRLAHDLIGNIGSIANAVELLNEGDEEDKEAINNMLNLCSPVLSKRMIFFRRCFGLSNAPIKTVDELFKLTADYLSTLGNPNFPISFNMYVETAEVYKLVMPAVMMMADTIIKGGEINVKQTAEGLHISAVSEKPLDNNKLQNMNCVLQGQKVSDNPSVYAPLYYLLSYLDGSGVPVCLQGNTLILGE